MSVYGYFKENVRGKSQLSGLILVSDVSEFHDFLCVSVSSLKKSGLEYMRNNTSNSYLIYRLR